MIFPKVDISANEHEKTLSSQSLGFLFEKAKHKEVVGSQARVLKEPLMHAWARPFTCWSLCSAPGHTGEWDWFLLSSNRWKRETSDPAIPACVQML